MAHVHLPLMRKCIDADKQDRCFPPGGLRSDPRPVRPGIVVRVDEVDLPEAGQGRLHLVPRVRLQPLHVRFEDDFEGADPSMPSPRNPLWRSCPGVEVIRPLSSTRLPLSAQSLQRSTSPPRGRSWLSAPMKQVYWFTPDHPAVEHDHRDARLDRLADRGS